MTTRERNRYALCQVITESVKINGFRAEAILEAYRQSVFGLWGDLGRATFGANSKVVVTFADSCGLFIIKFPMKAQEECLLALQSILDISGRSVTVRAIHISGRLKNVVKVMVDRVLIWRNTLPSDYAIPRKSQLDQTTREIINSLHSLPGYL
jgi:RNase P/RNase MRP subunit POP5